MEQTELNGTTADTIVALATPPGTGGIAVVCVCQDPMPWPLPTAYGAVSRYRMWREPYRLTLGEIIGEDGNPIDMALVTVFRGRTPSRERTPWNSHCMARGGSSARRWPDSPPPGRAPPQPENSHAARFNNRLDLAQAEAVADLIAAESKAAHRLAMTIQMSGSFSRKLESLRERLVELASLLELELDFSEEEVEFADRSRLLALVQEVLDQIDRLVSTYRAGRPSKRGPGGDSRPPPMREVNPTEQTPRGGPCHRQRHPRHHTRRNRRHTRDKWHPVPILRHRRTPRDR